MDLIFYMAQKLRRNSFGKELRALCVFTLEVVQSLIKSEAKGE